MSRSTGTYASCYRVGVKFQPVCKGLLFALVVKPGTGRPRGRLDASKPIGNTGLSRARWMANGLHMAEVGSGDNFQSPD